MTKLPILHHPYITAPVMYFRLLGCSHIERMSKVILKTEHVFQIIFGWREMCVR
jgi:hypothetical protein